jgi:hypothetical protein
MGRSTAHAALARSEGRAKSVVQRFREQGKTREQQTCARARARAALTVSLAAAGGDLGPRQQA